MFENDVKEINFSKVLPPISVDEEKTVRKYVNPNFFQVDLMVEYLNTHDKVDLEIFEKTITPQAARTIRWTFLKVMKPISRELFIKRIPIYFYDLNVSEGPQMDSFFDGYRSYMVGEDSVEELFKRMSDPDYDYPEGFDFEDLYKIIDDITGNYKIPMEKVLEYIEEQAGDVSNYDVFEKWYGYIGLVEDLNEDNVFPNNIFYSYNIELEKHGKEPLMYYPATDPRGDYIAFKEGNYFNIGGYFPIDENDEVAYKWVAIWPYKIRKHTEEEMAEIAEATARKEALKKKGVVRSPKLRTTLRIPIGQETRIFIGNRELVSNGAFESDDVYREYWEEAYSAPKYMKLDSSKIAKIREKRGYTVRDVVDATGINIRTYQRIETGEGTPDALNLMKIMNFLEIDDYETLIYRETLEDPGFEKFKSEKNIGKFINSEEASAISEKRTEENE